MLEHIHQLAFWCVTWLIDRQKEDAMKDSDQRDQPIEKPTYNDSEIARQLQEGLLSRSEADVFDILATSGVVSSVNSSSVGNEQAERSNEQTQRMLISHIHLRCLWNNVPMLQRWIAQFLAKRQPDATIIAGGMAKQGVTKIAVNKQQAIEGFLVIGSTARELHGSIAEQLAAHFVAEGQITGYTIYTISIDITIG
jgi:hypothetical protein